MSHAIYQFLMDLDIAAAEADAAKPELQDQSILQSAIERFETQFDSRLDENNYWRAIQLSLIDRPAIVAEDVEDDRSAHQLLEEQTQADSLFAKAIAESWLYSAAEFVLEAQIVQPDTLPITNQPEVRKEFMARMAKQFEAYDAKQESPISKSDQSYAKWLKARIKKSITYARASKIGAFTTSKTATPYDWRCFDLRTDRKIAPNAILYLDVHT